MYAALHVKVTMGGRTADYGAESVQIDEDGITIILDAGEGEESPGNLNLGPNADVGLLITADY